MRISEISEDIELQDLKQRFFEYFKDGFVFEEFLKEYLVKMGLDEVEVTQRTGDKGIDLVAVRKGVGDFSEIDVTKYHIQAKRYNPKGTNIPPKDVQALRGTLQNGCKGIFITTAAFSQNAIDDANGNNMSPIVLIDGTALINSCIDNGIGFVYKPVFSIEEMDKLLCKTRVADNDGNNENNEKIDISKLEEIPKLITLNDIRSRIISIPSAIMKKFDIDMQRVCVVVNNSYKTELNIIRGRNYLGGVTALLQEFELLSEDGVNTAKQAKWSYNENEKVVYIKIED